jgi:penicillin-binding protein 1A
MDWELSVYADSVLNKYLSRVEKGYLLLCNTVMFLQQCGYQYPLFARGFIIDGQQHRQVLAMIGGRNFAHSKLNRITQAKRQPVVHKTYLLHSCSRTGYTPATVIYDAPITLTGGNERIGLPKISAGYITDLPKCALPLLILTMCGLLKLLWT